MSPIETSGAALTRGSPHSNAQGGFAMRSGADKALSLQSVQTSAAAAPVETERAIAQAQAAAKSRMRIETARPEPSQTRSPQPEQPRAKPSPSEQIARQAAQAAQKSAHKANPSLSKPMTAVLLHELRLQQELADVQEEMSKKRA